MAYYLVLTSLHCCNPLTHLVLTLFSRISLSSLSNLTCTVATYSILYNTCYLLLPSLPFSVATLLSHLDSYFPLMQSLYLPCCNTFQTITLFSQFFLNPSSILSQEFPFHPFLHCCNTNDCHGL